MNIVARFVLSLALIALIAQPIQAATYRDYVKKTIRIAGYSAAFGCGVLLVKSLDKPYKNSYHNGFLGHDPLGLDPVIEKTKTVAALALFGVSIYGLYKETVPGLIKGSKKIFNQIKKILDTEVR